MASTSAQTEGHTERPSRTPDFFIVGHPKSGTTALYQMLRAHPQIFMPAVKEPHFLGREPRLSVGNVKKYPASLEGYLALFAGAGPQQQVGEASSSYLRSEIAAERIAELCPDARIIAIFREPGSFLRSLHLQLLQSGVETEKDLGKAIALEERRRRDDAGDSFWAQMLLYSEHVRYTEQLRRYHAVFPRERVLALIYDDFRTDNGRVVRQVQRFLGVDATVPIAPAEANPTVRVRSHNLQHVLRELSLGRGPVPFALKVGLKAVTPGPLRRRTLRAVRQQIVQAAPPPPDQRQLDELRRRFRAEVVALSEYLDRDLVREWGCDDLG